MNSGGREEEGVNSNACIVMEGRWRVMECFALKRNAWTGDCHTDNSRVSVLHF